MRNPAHMLGAAALFALPDSLLWLTLLRPQAMAYAFSPEICVGLHAMLAGLLALLVHARRAPDAPSPVIAPLTGVVLLAFGPFGAFGLLPVWRMTFSRTPPTARLYHIDQEEGERGLPDAESEERSAARIRLDELRKVAPLADGMTDEDKDIRVAAILAMDGVDSPHIRDVLLAATDDPHKAVQYYALEVLKKIGDEYTKQIKTLLNRINTESNPGYETYKRLADLYAQFAASGIEHPVLMAFYQQESVKYYSHILKAYPERRKETLQQVIPALHANADYRRCVALCEEVRHDPDLAEMAILYTARSLFDLRDLPALKAFALQEHDSGLEALPQFLQLAGEEAWHG